MTYAYFCRNHIQSAEKFAYLKKKQYLCTRFGIMAKKNEIAKADSAHLQPLENIENLIHVIRGKQVMLDRDLARLYGVEARALNQAVQRNRERFPEDFMFQLSKEEFENLRSQIVTSSEEKILKSQNVISSWGGIRKYERIREAKKRIVLIDNYVDETVLAMLDKRGKNVTAKVYTRNISRQLSLDFEKHNAQYTPIEVEQFDRAHDRFLCIDDTVYLIGASIKDLGKKWFGFVKLEQTTDELLSKM